MPKAFTATLMLRIKLAVGKHRYVPVAVHTNGRLKPHTGLLNGKPVYHPEATYYLGYWTHDRRIYEPLGKDRQAALTPSYVGFTCSKVSRWA